MLHRPTFASAELQRPEYAVWAACRLRALGMCCTQFDDGPEPSVTGQEQLSTPGKIISARRLIFRRNESTDGIPVICDGWAIAVANLADGRRQILSILLPGDIVSAALLFENKLQFAVEAVTDVRYSNINRADFKTMLVTHPNLVEKFTRAGQDALQQAYQLVIDLGTRTADERIARLILHLKERLARSGMVRDLAFEFPLRQTHIADATGLSSVHVSKVMGRFRESGLIAITHRVLTILDQAELQRVAGIMQRVAGIIKSPAVG
jgi:CRP/FNR family transcriptional regulator